MYNKYCKTMCAKDSNGEIFDFLVYSIELTSIVDRALDKINDICGTTGAIENGTLEYDIVAMICLMDKDIGLLSNEDHNNVVSYFGLRGHRTAETVSYLTQFTALNSSLYTEKSECKRANIQQYLTTGYNCYITLLNLLRALTGKRYTRSFEIVTDNPVYFNDWNSRDDFRVIDDNGKLCMSFKAHIGLKNSVLSTLDTIYRTIVEEACGKQLKAGHWINASMNKDFSWVGDSAVFEAKASNF